MGDRILVVAFIGVIAIVITAFISRPAEEENPQNSGAGAVAIKFLSGLTPGNTVIVTVGGGPVPSGITFT